MHFSHLYPAVSRWICGEQTCCCSLRTTTTKLLHLLPAVLWSTLCFTSDWGEPRQVRRGRSSGFFLYRGRRKWSPENLHRCNERQHEEPPQPNCDLIQAFVGKLLALAASQWAVRAMGDVRELQHLEGLLSEMRSVPQGAEPWKIRYFSRPQPQDYTIS